MVAACHTATSYFNLWLKAAGYGVVKANTLPTAGNALAIVVTFAFGVLADHFPSKRAHFIIGLCLFMMLSNIILSVWNVPKSALLFAYYISYTGSATTPILIVSILNFQDLLEVHSNLVARLGDTISMLLIQTHASCLLRQRTLSHMPGCFGYHVSFRYSESYYQWLIWFHSGALPNV